jgi:hypothetical protein
MEKLGDQHKVVFAGLLQESAGNKVGEEERVGSALRVMNN